VNWRFRFVILSDRLTCLLIVVLILGSVLCFGGAVWWFPPVMIICAFLLAATRLAHNLATGQMPIMKSPLGLLGMFALGLGVLQLAPLPAGLASRISPAAHEVYAMGLLPRLVHADDSEASLPEAPPIRSPASVDRSATLRWLVEAAACLAIFWSVSHFTDSLGRLYLVWGLVIAGFLFNAALAVVQITNSSDGPYGCRVAASGTSWLPSYNDLLEAPTTAAALRNLADSPEPGDDMAAAPSRAVLVPPTPFLFGTTIGGAGAFLAMGALALPLAMAIVLHLFSPRGGRARLWDRLDPSSHGSLVILLLVMMFIGSFLIGLVAGPWFCLPVVLGLAAVGLPALLEQGSRWPAFFIVILLSGGIGLGVLFEACWTALLGGQSPVAIPDPNMATAIWSESMQIFSEFPLVGAGMGSFGVIHPYFKARDLCSTTAMSSLVQWSVESGSVGIGILALALLWCLIRLPAVVKRIGLVERPLAHGLIGAALSFGALAAVHWTIELSAVAISASALGGTWNRWLAGGTDLFLERG
jgi:hypothetical protein